MIDLNIEVCERIKNARRAQKLSQSELAAAVGCKQSALSAFESGNITKISEEIVKKIAENLGIDLAAAAALPPMPPEGALGYCPEPNCPSNTRYTVGTKTFYRVSLVSGRFCAHCGEVIEYRCGECGASINPGAVCTHCGTAYIAR